MIKKKDNSIRSVKGEASEWDEGIFIVLILMIILIPLVFYPHCMPVFAPIKDLSFQILALLALILWILKIINLSRLTWQKINLDIPVLLFLIWGCLSLIWSINIYKSILALPLFLSGPVIFYVVSQSLQEQNSIHKLLLIIIIVGTIMGAYGILQYLGIDFEFWKGNIGRNQVFGLFGNVNYFAEYIILPLAIAIGLFLAREKVFSRTFLLFSILIMGMALLLTFTRSAYLGIAISIPIMLFLFIKNTPNKLNKKYYKKILINLLVLIIIAVAIIYIPHPLNQGNTTLGKLRNRITLESVTSGGSILRRIATWKFTWLMIEDYFLWGSGLGTYNYHTLKYQGEFFSQGQNRDIYPHGHSAQAHNEYLQIWSEWGIIGLLMFLGIIFFYYRNILIKLKKMEEKEQVIIIGLAGAIAAVLIDAFFGFPLQLAASLSLFWIFLGLTVAQVNIIDAHFREKLTYPKANNQPSAVINNEQKSQGSMGLLRGRKIFLSFLVICLMVVCISFLIRPFVSRVYLYYGNYQLSRNNDQEAIKNYEKGMKWNPWLGEIYYNLGGLLSSRGFINPSLEYFHKAEKFMDHPYLPQNIASLYLKRGEHEKAIPYLERAIKYQKDKKSMLPLQIELGNSYLILKDYKNAERCFLEAIKSFPDHAEAYYGLAGVYMSQNKKEQAIEALNKVIELAPQSKIAAYAATYLKKLK